MIRYLKDKPHDYDPLKSGESQRGATASSAKGRHWLAMASGPTAFGGPLVANVSVGVLQDSTQFAGLERFGDQIKGALLQPSIQNLSSAWLAASTSAARAWDLATIDRASSHVPS